MASREEYEYSSQAPAGYIGSFLERDIFPRARNFLYEQFRDMGQEDSSPFTYTGPRVAEFDPREKYAMELSDQAIGSYRPYLGEQSGLIDEASETVRGGLGEFDPSSISGFYDPYEDQVVQQTLKDVREGLAKGDMGMRDQAVQGGAFGGARSRLRREDLAADTARGAAEAVGGIRSAGYQGARGAAQQAFEAARARQMQGAGQLGGLGSMYGGMAQALPGLQGQDISRMMGMGGLGRGRSQSKMDLAYQDFVGRYNLPMQTLQNVGAITASLGPLAGGYGYAGATAAPYGSPYAPSTGFMGGFGGYGGYGGRMSAPNVGIPGAYNSGTFGGGIQAGSPIDMGNFNNAYSNFNAAAGNMPPPPLPINTGRGEINDPTAGTNLQTPTGGSLF